MLLINLAVVNTMHHETVRVQSEGLLKALILDDLRNDVPGKFGLAVSGHIPPFSLLFGALCLAVLL